MTQCFQQVSKAPDQYHEQEIILLQTAEPCAFRSLHRKLLGLGLVMEDDFFYSRRNDEIASWQSELLCTIEVFLDGAKLEVYEDDIFDQSYFWDELRVSYLMATLPKSNIERCIQICGTLAEDFDLSASMNGRIKGVQAISDELINIADTLATDFDAPGSEVLAILIEMQYDS